MPQLTEVNIQNLRGLQDLTLQDTRTFNLIVGPSEIGKTTVLEGIFISSALAFMRGLVNINQARHVNMEGEEKAHSSLESLFRNWDAPSIDTQLKIKNTAAEYGCNVSFTKYYGDETVIELKNQTEYKSENGKKLRGIKCNVELTGETSGKLERLLLVTKDQQQNQAMQASVAPATIIELLKIKNETLDVNQLREYFPHSVLTAGKDFFNGVEYAIKNNKEELILRELQKINPNIEYIGIVGQAIMVDIGLGFKVDVHTSGGAINEALSILGTLFHPEMDIFLIDEIGKNIYYASLKEYLRATLSLCKQQNKQIFATTHSKDMLIALNELLQEEAGFQEDVMCYSMARNKHGKVQAYSYDHQTIERCIANDIEIR